MRKMYCEIKREVKCTDCGTDDHLLENDGHYVCSNCGLVQNEAVIDMDQEWHNYDDDTGEDKSRVGSVSDPLLSNDLSTEIGKGRNSKQLIRAHIRATKEEPDVKLKEGFQKIQELTEKMQLATNVRDTAKEIYNEIFKSKLVNSKNDIAGFVAGSVLHACRNCKVSRAIKDFEGHSGLKKKIIGKYMRKIDNAMKVINEGKNPEDVIALNDQSSTPAQMIPRIANELQLSPKVQLAAEKIAEKAPKLGITSGRAPSTIAAASILLCVQLHNANISVKEISKATGVSVPTINKCLKDLEVHLSVLTKESS